MNSSKSYNIKKCILQVHTNKEITVDELSRRTDIPRPTVYRMMGHLIGTGLVNTVRKQGNGVGRKTRVFAINKDYLHILGVYIGKSYIEVFVTGLYGEMKTNWIYYLEGGYNLRQILDILDTGITAVMRNVSNAADIKNKLGAVSIAVTASISGDQKSIRVFNRLECLNNFPIVSYMENKYGLPTMLVKTSMLHATSYLWEFSGNNMDNYIYVDISSGVGFGIVIDGKLYRGAFSNAGEIADLPMPNHKSGAKMEEVYSTRNLYTHLRNYIAESNDQALQQYMRQLGMNEANQKERMMQIAEYCLEEGDPKICDVIRNACDGWAELCRMIIAFFDPKYLIVGGAINTLTPRAFNLICERIKKNLDTQTIIIADKQKNALETVVAMNVQEKLIERICDQLTGIDSRSSI